MLSKTKSEKLLDSFAQEHIKVHLESLSTQEKEKLYNHLEEINTKLLKEQIKSLTKQKKAFNPEEIQPYLNFEDVNSEDYASIGEKIICDGKVICLLIAGGQGTRLNFSGPKGQFPITRIRKKSLFQFFSERVIAASIRYNRKLPLAIMTSEQNHLETITFFQKNNYFGLSKSQVAFFQQDSLPLLSKDGKLILDSSHSIARGPDGNGKALLKLLKASSTAHFFENRPSYVNVVLIDNPLADPYDATLIGYHHQMENCATIKCTSKKNPDEKVGVLGTYQNKPHVFEYSEFPNDCLNKDDFKLANLSLYCFSIDFLKRASSQEKKLPLHLAWKKSLYLNKSGQVTPPEIPNAWKFEYFIFDLLPLTVKCSALVYPRSECFAPLKNASGPDSITTLQESLLKYDQHTLEKITGLPSPNINLEISPKFYYPTPELIKKWKGKSPSLEKTYIDP